MAWLDNVIAFFNPEAAARRAAWRNAYEELRNYDAGDFGRLNSGWRVTNDSAEVTDRNSREWVRARARDLERNSDIMNSVIGAYKRNVIGSGFQIQAKTKNSKLNKDLEHLWKKWCKARNCDVTGNQSLNEMLRMAVTITFSYFDDSLLLASVSMSKAAITSTPLTTPASNGNRVAIRPHPIIPIFTLVVVSALSMVELIPSVLGK